MDGRASLRGDVEKVPFNNQNKKIVLSSVLGLGSFLSVVLLVAYLVEVLLLLTFPITVAVQSIIGAGGSADFVRWTNPYLLTFSRYSFRTKTDGIDLAQFDVVSAGGRGCFRDQAMRAIELVGAFKA